MNLDTDMSAGNISRPFMARWCEDLSSVELRVELRNLVQVSPFFFPVSGYLSKSRWNRNGPRLFLYPRHRLIFLLPRSTRRSIDLTCLIRNSTSHLSPVDRLLPVIRASCVATCSYRSLFRLLQIFCCMPLLLNLYLRIHLHAQQCLCSAHTQIQQCPLSLVAS